MVRGEGVDMISYFVRYRGYSTDAEQFYTHYENQHAAILKQFPGIRSLILHRPMPWTDSFPINRGETFLLAQMQFDGGVEFERALKSEARREAREDFHRFPPFSGEVTHEAMAGKLVF